MNVRQSNYHIINYIILSFFYALKQQKTIVTK